MKNTKITKKAKLVRSKTAKKLIERKGMIAERYRTVLQIKRTPSCLSDERV